MKRASPFHGLLLCLAAAAATQTAVAQDSPATVTVQRFEVSGNTLLSSGIVEATLAAYKGARTLPELRRAAEALQQRYVEAGWGGVVVFLPPQSGADGVVALSVVEGKLGAITVQGNTVFDEASVRASVPDLRLGATPQMRRIDGQIEIANENPSRRLQVLLKPGVHSGQIAAEVAVQDRPLQTMTFGVDDTGNQRTGRYRAGFTWQHANVTGRDDVLTAQYQTSPTRVSQVTVLSAAYRLPLPSRLAVLDGYAAYSDVDAGTSATAAGNVRINGRGNLAGLRSTWYLPRWNETDQRVALALDRREYLNLCEVSGLASGACGPAGGDVAVTPLSIEYSLRGGSPRWSATVALLSNLDLGGSKGGQDNFSVQRSQATPHFSAVRAALGLDVALGERWLLRGRASAQASGDALVSGEQFGIGGAASVRGYEERELVGDRGIALSAEMVGPEMLDRARLGAPSLRMFALADAGVVSNNHGAPCRDTAARCSLAALGAGVLVEREQLQARLVVAIALRDAVLTRRHDARAHFAASYWF